MAPLIQRNEPHKRENYCGIKEKRDVIHVMETSCETRRRTSAVLRPLLCRCWLCMSGKEMHNLGVCALSKRPEGIKSGSKKLKKTRKAQVGETNISTCAPVLNLSSKGLGGLAELLPGLLSWPRSPRSQLAASSGLCPSGSVVDCGPPG